MKKKIEAYDVAQGVFIMVMVFLLGHVMIWSLNTLFGLAIPHDVQHWLAAVALAALVALNGRQ
jgi:hypothetical protein